MSVSVYVYVSVSVSVSVSTVTVSSEYTRALTLENLHQGSVMGQLDAATSPNTSGFLFFPPSPPLFFVELDAATSPNTAGVCKVFKSP